MQFQFNLSIVVIIIAVVFKGNSWLVAMGTTASIPGEHTKRTELLLEFGANLPNAWVSSRASAWLVGE